MVCNESYVYCIFSEELTDWLARTSKAEIVCIDDRQNIINSRKIKVNCNMQQIPNSQLLCVHLCKFILVLLLFQMLLLVLYKFKKNPQLIFFHSFVEFFGVLSQFFSMIHLSLSLKNVLNWSIKYIHATYVRRKFRLNSALNMRKFTHNREDRN